MDEIQNMAAEMLEALEGDIEYGWEANGEQIEEFKQTLDWSKPEKAFSME